MMRGDDKLNGGNHRPLRRCAVAHHARDLEQLPVAQDAIRRVAEIGRCDCDAVAGLGDQRIERRRAQLVRGARLDAATDRSNEHQPLAGAEIGPLLQCAQLRRERLVAAAAVADAAVADAVADAASAFDQHVEHYLPRAIGESVVDQQEQPVAGRAIGLAAAPGRAAPRRVVDVDEDQRRHQTVLRCESGAAAHHPVERRILHRLDP